MDQSRCSVLWSWRGQILTDFLSVSIGLRRSRDWHRVCCPRRGGGSTCQGGPTRQRNVTSGCGTMCGQQGGPVWQRYEGAWRERLPRPRGVFWAERPLFRPSKAFPPFYSFCFSDLFSILVSPFKLLFQNF
jgi:hypothetical protein